MAKSGRRTLALSVSLQALGPLSAFATVFVVATGGGASAQGQFAQSKAWVDLLVVLGTFGFPQGIVYVVNRQGASARRLAWVALGYALAFVPLAWTATLVGARHDWVGDATGAAEAWVPAMAAALLVLHGLWRGVCLTRNQGAVFALLTAAPAMALLACVSLRSGQGPFAPLIMGSAVVAAVAGAAAMVTQLRDVPGAKGPLPWRSLWTHGSHVFVQAVLMALQPLLAYALVRHAGGGNAGVGWFHVGVFIVQGLVVPVGLVAPLLFARWTAEPDAGLLERLRSAAPRWLAWGGMAGLVLAAGVAWAVPLWFGEAYRAASAPAAVMALTLPLAAYSRVVAPALHAHGMQRVNTASAAWRLGSMGLLGWALAASPAGAPLGVAVAWSVAELVALAWTLRGLTAAAARSAGHATVEAAR